MVIVVAIVGILAALVIPSFTRSNDLADMRAASRKLMGTLVRARTLASSGKNENYPGWLPTDRTAQAGLFLTTTDFRLFVDRNNVTDGDEIILEVVDFTEAGSNYAANVLIQAPPAEIRFQRNGTLTTTTNQDIVLEDQGSGLRQTIRLTYGGSVRLF
jgi:type II secretory pathway pseudopilin PulG